MIAWTIYITFAAALLVVATPGRFSRWVALGATGADLVVSSIAFFKPASDPAHYTTLVRVPWIPTLGMNYQLAVDGISLTMVLVTSLTAVSAVLFSWELRDRR